MRNHAIGHRATHGPGVPGGQVALAQCRHSVDTAPPGRSRGPALGDWPRAAYGLGLGQGGVDLLQDTFEILDIADALAVDADAGGVALEAEALSHGEVETFAGSAIAPYSTTRADGQHRGVNAGRAASAKPVTTRGFGVNQPLIDRPG